MIDSYIKDIIKKTKGSFETGVNPTSMIRWYYDYAISPDKILQQEHVFTKYYLTELGGEFKELKITQWTKWMDVPYG